MKQLQSILDQLESHIPDFEKTNPAVSASTVGWQIDHSLLVINKVTSEIKDSNPDDYKCVIISRDIKDYENKNELVITYKNVYIKD